MLFRFPPEEVPHHDPTFLCGKNAAFAKLKIENKAGKRRVFLTQHTLLMVTKGTKLLHFANYTASVNEGQLMLLKKGIYVMAEYLEPGIDFEALLLFLPVDLLRSMAVKIGKTASESEQSYIIFEATTATQLFKANLRQYFHQPNALLDELLPLKQKEILLLLMASGYQKQVTEFINQIAYTNPGDLQFVVNNYLFQPITINELASLCNRSLSAFKRDFQQVYNATPRSWINQQRVSQARLLLQNTDVPIAEIARQCGFDDPSYFIRLFKSVTGITPSALRTKSAIV